MIHITEHKELSPKEVQHSRFNSLSFFTESLMKNISRRKENIINHVMTSFYGKDWFRDARIIGRINVILKDNTESYCFDGRTLIVFSHIKTQQNGFNLECFFEYEIVVDIPYPRTDHVY